MKRLRDLDKPQKIILALLLIMVLVFSILYPLTISRVGFEYMDTILVVSQENGSTVYSGKINGEKARFTVSEDKSVMFTCGDKSYGPFTVVEDPTAVPDDSGSRSLTGIELREGDEVLFRGGVLECSNGMSFFIMKMTHTPVFPSSATTAKTILLHSSCRIKTVSRATR